MRRVLVLATAGLLLAAAAACSSGTSGPSSGTAASTVVATPSGPARPSALESNPPGDIPDNQVFITWSPPGATFSLKVPEGWSRTSAGAAIVFTDKFNSVRIEQVTAATAPTVDSVRTGEMTRIQRDSKSFRLRDVTQVQRPAGTAILATYRADSAPDPVTGKTVPQDVERYVFWRAATETVLTLAGPVDADNVDPWRIVTDSFRWSG